MNLATNGSVVSASPGGGRLSVTTDLKSGSNMAWKKSPDLPNPIPPRPPLATQQSNSLPTSPYQYPRDLPLRTRSPSLGRDALNTSPRSILSESGQTLPSGRGIRGGCKYENAQSYFKRRIPYSEGDEMLGRPDKPPKDVLTAEEERKLTSDMKALYDKLLPTAESEDRRARLVRKLEHILKERWPENQINVKVFGSSGNKLGTSDSDVDISVMTDCKDMEIVCNLAELFARKGMERIVCIANAKVPLVKIWDPELGLACDMNVNQDIAVENTTLIKTYVELDERVRPLAMIIKYWTRRRILNDAGRNYTISSYTWICMIINFLQTRKPPILPSLQQQSGIERREVKNVDVSFATNTKQLRKYGSENTESVGQLLFHFFRYYGYELDYEKSVISVRQAKVVDKSGRWQSPQNNRLCVEEPFNTSWNLGKTADGFTFRGVHKEMRRAFEYASQADLEICCEPYVFPKEELRTAAIPIQRPTQTVTVQPSRNPRGNRGGRSNNTFPRNSQTQGRRASSASTRGQNYGRQPQWPIVAQDLSLQAEQQYLLHDHLYRQYQLLQAQEQELRMQLHQQALQNGGAYPALLWPHFRIGQDELGRPRAVSGNHPPAMSAPLRQGQFSYGSQFPITNVNGIQGISTSPPSPLSTSAAPDMRRNSRRSSVHSGSTSSTLRAHSQPAQRPLRSPIPQHVAHLEASIKSPPLDVNPRRGQGSSEGNYGTDFQPAYFPASPTASTSNDSGRNSAYTGYYAGNSPEPFPQTTSMPAHPSNENYDPFVINSEAISTDDSRSLGQSSLNSSVAPGDAKLGEDLPQSRDSPNYRQSTSQNSMAPLVIDGSKPLVRRKTRSEDSNYPQSTERDGEQQSSIGFHVSTAEDLSTSASPVINGLKRSTQHDALGIMHGHPSPEALGPSQWSSSPDAESQSKTGPHSIDMNQRNGEIIVVNTISPSEIEPVPRSKVLSPVKEVRTPSPTFGRGQSAAMERLNVSHKLKPMSKQERLSPSSRLENIPIIPIVSTGSANGATTTELKKTSPNGQHNANGWQTATTKKKHKKGSKSTNDMGYTNAIGGEFLPADEKLRKGG